MSALLKDLKVKPESYWIKRGEKMALRLFQAMAKRVPAYKDFLRKHGVKSEKIKTANDFKSVPPISKDDYLRQYPLQKLCWDGILDKKHWVFSATSGSTGEPFYFPREDRQDRQYALTADLYLRSNFDVHKKSTLYINGFAMGVWIGGLFTYQAIKHAVDSGHSRLSIINPGLNKPEIIKAVRKLAPHYDQVIIGGYPPFVKDLLDDGIREGLRWHDYNLKFIFSAEGFSELFRDYIIKKAGLKNIYKDTLNHYGTVDLGTMSHETPLSILIRRMAVKKKDIFKMVFGEINKLPTLTQFLPELFFFEEVNGGLFCSAFSGLPLVRYNLKDNGGVFSFKEIFKKFSDSGIDLRREIKNAKIADTVWNLPFVYVYERNDFTVSLYGANIYPETIRKALQIKSLENLLTGKFTMRVLEGENRDPYLELNTELRPGIKEAPLLKQKTQEAVICCLLKENSEYKNNYAQMPEKVSPRIIFWPYEHSLYFKSGGKQKWIKK